MAAPEQQRLTSAERENLVAYLDGELSEPEHQALASKLTYSISARREAEALEKTWELLDTLPRPQASPEFVSRTLASVQGLTNLDDRIADVARVTARNLTGFLALAAAAGAVVAIGYAGARWAWPDPSARLLRNLPIAESLDDYRAVGDFEFLEQLDAHPLFNGGTP